MSLLERLFDEAKEGKGCVVFIGGKAGSGKTRLINELRGFAYSRGAVFCSGKSYRTSYSVPYSLVREVLEDYITRIERMPQEVRSALINRMQEAVGQLGKEIEKITPLVRNLWGDQPALVKLEPFKEHTRFLLTAGRFIRAMSSEDVPVVMFLDDVQWIDGSSVEVIGEAVKGIEKSNLLIVMAYREEEIEENEAVKKLMDKIKEGASRYEEVKVRHLSREETTTMISEMLSSEISEVQRLAEKIYSLSEGLSLIHI